MTARQANRKEIEKFMRKRTLVSNNFKSRLHKTTLRTKREDKTVNKILNEMDREMKKL